MLKFIKSRVKRVLDIYPRWLVRWEYDHQTFTRFNERPVEFAYVFRKLAEIYPKTVLDVGTGKTAVPHLIRNCGCVVTAMDNVRDYWSAGMFNRHYHVIDDDITRPRVRGTFDLVTCISVLEHVREHDAAVGNMFRMLNPGGHLLMTFPYTEGGYLSNVYDMPESSYGQDFGYTTQSYSRENLDRWLAANGAEIVDQEYWRFWEGAFWTAGRQIIPPQRVGVGDPHQLTCVLMRRRA